MKFSTISLIIIILFFSNCSNWSFNNKISFKLEMHRLNDLASKQRIYYLQNNQYSNTISELDSLLDGKIIDKCLNCNYFIIKNDSTSFIIQSLNLTDFDNDGKFRMMTINEKGEFSTLQED